MNAKRSINYAARSNKLLFLLLNSLRLCAFAVLKIFDRCKDYKQILRISNNECFTMPGDIFPLQSKTILIIITGGIAAYKSLELIRLLRKSGAAVRVILTKAGAEFVTPLSVAALSGHAVYQDLFSLKDETEMGHIRLSREADLVVVAPASADFIAKMAQGRADDLASTTLLACNKPILIAPAMNCEMWLKPAFQRNLSTLRHDGVEVIGPAHGDLACGETGSGRMVEADEILEKITVLLRGAMKLNGLRALVTSGPTFEPIDPVRFIGNRSSGKQGHAIAAELAAMGAEVTLVTGPVQIPPPSVAHVINVETAAQMRDACAELLSAPVDIAVCAAAVADWRVSEPAAHKIKKSAESSTPQLKFVQNDDILKMISHHQSRPKLVIGFAAETENLLEFAAAKLKAKNCDWIVANHVGPKELDTQSNMLGKTCGGVFGSDENQATLITSSAQTPWPLMSKQDLAKNLVAEIVKFFER